MIQNLPTDQIVLRSDARAIDATAVAGLADSIAEAGLINPIRVRVAGDGWEVVAGAHRLEACKSLGLAEIAADVVEDDDLHAELAMIDENLCRVDLSPSDRARQVARRKAIYQELHPETRRGGDHKSIKYQTSEFDPEPVERFSLATAKATGRPESSVILDANRGENILPEVLDLIRGTSLDTGVYLDKLKKLPGNEQYRAAKRDMAAERQRRLTKAKPKIVRVADAPLDDEDAQERQVAALMSAWNKSSAEARAEFLDRIGAEQIARAA